MTNDTFTEEQASYEKFIKAGVSMNKNSCKNISLIGVAVDYNMDYVQLTIVNPKSTRTAAVKAGIKELSQKDKHQIETAVKNRLILMIRSVYYKDGLYQFNKAMKNVVFVFDGEHPSLVDSKYSAFLAVRK